MLKEPTRQKRSGAIAAGCAAFALLLCLSVARGQEGSGLHSGHMHSTSTALQTSFFDDLLKTYTPRRVCMFYESSVIWLHVISDGMIALAYYSIPFALAYFVWRRRDLAYSWIFWMFAGFILTCGTTHLFSVIDVWHPLYKIDGLVKLATAVLSIGTAIALWPLIPKALALPSTAQLERTVRERTAELARANRELRQSESFYRQTLESIPGMVFTTRPDGYCDYQSQQWVDYTGVPMSEHLGDGWNKLLYPDDRPRAFAAWRSAVEGRAPYDLEYRVRRYDGEYEWFRVIGRPIRDAGQVVRWFGVAMNIEELKRAEEELAKANRDLRQSEELRRMAQQMTAVGSFDWNVVTGKNTWTPELEAMYGLPAGGFPGTQQAWEQLVHPEDRERAVRAVERAFQTNETVEEEWRVVWPDGSVHWLVGRFRVLWDEAGKPLRLTGVNIDITARKQAETQLRLLSEVVESAANGIAVTDRNAKILWVNRAFTKLTGYDRGEVMGQNPRILKSGEQPVEFYQQLWKTILQGDAWSGQLVNRRKDNSLYDEEMTITPVRVGGKEISHFIAIKQDITERKRAEEELKAARVSAERAKAAAEQASTAKDHFLAVLSHELRTPLTPVLATVSLLQENTALDAQTQEDLEVVRRNVELEARLIDDLLDLTRIARGRIDLDKHTIDLCTVLHRAVEVCLPDIEARKVEFEIDMGPAAPYRVEADAARLQQVFWNILRNAIKFTPQGGCIGIRCRPDRDHIVVEVNDSGVGIEPEALGRIFNAFEQAGRSISRQFGGLGLGLAISKALVEIHGGTISAHSEGAGKGASFRVRLPLVKHAVKVLEPAGALPEAAERPEAARQTGRILLVEDHGDTARIMANVLTRSGYEVRSAGDVASALNIAREWNFDLLISDLGLPDRSGLELIREIRRFRSDVPAIALSGYGTEQDLAQSREAGFHEHLIKPVGVSTLKEKVASMFGTCG